MCFPLCALRANSVRASKIFRLFFTAVLAHLAIGTDFHAVFTFAALHTESDAVGAVFTTAYTEVVITVTAIVAVTAHDVGTVNANAAFGTKFIHTSGAFATALADVFRAVCTDDTAVLTDLRAIATPLAILAEQILCAFSADIAGSTEFVCAVGAFLATVRTEIRTVFASLAAGTYCSAVGAESAGNAEAVRASTVNACAAFRAHLSVRAVRTFFVTILANGGTVGTAKAAAVADVIHTVFANGASVAEVTLTAHTFPAYAAVGTQLIARAVRASFAAFLADHIDTVGASAAASHADIIHAEFTNTAGVTEVTVSAHTVTAGTALGTQLIRCAIRAFFVALLADHLSALIASVSAYTQIFNAVDTFAAFGAKFAAGTVKTTFTLGAELIVRAVFAFFAAGYAYDGAVGAPVTAVADLVHTVFT